MWVALDTGTRQVAGMAVGNRSVFPAECRWEAGRTNHMERFGCPVRPRCARFVQKTLPFSRKMESHVGTL